MCGSLFNDDMFGSSCRNTTYISRDTYRMRIPSRGVYPEHAEQMIHEGMMTLLNQLPSDKLMELFEIRRYTTNDWNYDETVEIRFHRDVLVPNGMTERLTKEVNELESKKAYLQADITHLDWMIENKMEELTK